MRPYRSDIQMAVPGSPRVAQSAEDRQPDRCRAARDSLEGVAAEQRERGVAAGEGRSVSRAGQSLSARVPSGGQRQRIGIARAGDQPEAGDRRRARQRTDVSGAGTGHQPDAGSRKSSESRISSSHTTSPSCVTSRTASRSCISGTSSRWVTAKRFISRRSIPSRAFALASAPRPDPNVRRIREASWQATSRRR